METESWTKNWNMHHTRIPIYPTNCNVNIQFKAYSASFSFLFGYELYDISNQFQNYHTWIPWLQVELKEDCLWQEHKTKYTSSRGTHDACVNRTIYRGVSIARA